jgi:DNA polymerase-3 subunit epsilon
MYGLNSYLYYLLLNLNFDLIYIPNKSKQMNIFYLDFETTGLSPYLDDVIEIGIKKDGTDESYETFVKPKRMPRGSLYMYVPPFIVNLTGITDTMIYEQGIEKSVAAYNMYKYIEKHAEGGPIYIVSHNGNSFDFIFFRKLIHEYITNKGLGIKPEIIESIKYIDTLLLGKAFPKHKKFSQKAMCDKYQIINESEHRAIGDVIALEQLFNNLCIDYATYTKQEEKYYLENPEKIMLFI